MDFAPDELLSAIQGTAQRVAQDQRAATPAERERVGREGALHAGLLELLVSADPDEALGPTAFVLALHTLAQTDTGLALWVWAQNVAQSAAHAVSPDAARTWREGASVAVPLDLELAGGDGWHVSCGAMQALAHAASSWSVQAGQAGARTSVGVDGADIGLFVATREVTAARAPDLALAVAGLAAIAAGVAQRAARATAEYALVRQQFGHPIANFQAIQFMLADSQTGAEAGRLMALSTAGQSDLPAAARALSCAANAARNAADVAVQVHGGAGYTRDYPAEALLRDASLLQQVATRRFTATALPPFAQAPA
jgi:alkylation response protein AidB-like acyl-CoA dehydrogenase